MCVSIGNGLTSILGSTFRGCQGLINVFLPNSVTSIGGSAFIGCIGLTSLTIPSSVTSIGGSAFYNCWGLTSITCEADMPPICGSNAFNNVDKSIPLYVLAESIETYQDANIWRDFNNIQPIQAKETDVASINAAPTDNSVLVKWPAVSGANIYELIIKTKNGNVICTHIFNAQGQLISIVNNVPAHQNAPQQTQSTGFSFNVSGLESGTSYDLTIVAKDSTGIILSIEYISFNTTGEQGTSTLIEEVKENDKQEGGHKVLKDGQILILRGDKIYTLQGQEVK